MKKIMILFTCLISSSSALAGSPNQDAVTATLRSRFIYSRGIYSNSEFIQALNGGSWRCYQRNANTDNFSDQYSDSSFVSFDGMIYEKPYDLTYSARGYNSGLYSVKNSPNFFQTTISLRMESKTTVLMEASYPSAQFPVEYGSPADAFVGNTAVYYGVCIKLL